MDDARYGNFAQSECFLCSPEQWRTVYEGVHVRVVAGKGPLCIGYVLLAPKAHIETTAQLPTGVLEEFEMVEQILLGALQHEYGSGYTAYEHAKTGACAVDTEEKLGFCYHAHRVFIPWRTSLVATLRASSVNAIAPGSLAELAELGNSSYLYLSSGVHGKSREAVAYVPTTDLPPQFFRGLLTDELQLGRPHSWAVHFNSDEMLETTFRLRRWFAGLVTETTAVDLARRRVDLGDIANRQRWISLDGFSRTGKTAIARRLSDLLNVPFFDSGMLFRYIASELEKGLPVTRQSCRQYVERLPGETVKPVASREHLLQVVNNAQYRDYYDEIFADVVAKLPAGILVGRNAWQLVPQDSLRLLVQSSKNIRAYRTVLDLLRVGVTPPPLDEVFEQQTIGDISESKRLPQEGDCASIKVVDNDCRSLDAVLLDILELACEETNEP